MVDINKAAAASGGLDVPKTAPIQPAGGKRAPIQHQTSLSAQASAAVGAASEAGKFIANKLASEVNLKGAKEMVLAAANHLTGGGPPNSRIKFKNLDGEDYDDVDEDDNDYGDDGGETGGIESTMDDEDEDSEDFRRQSQRSKRNRKSQSVLSAALSSYKQRGGYGRTATYEEVGEEDEEEEEDDDDQERMKFNKSASFKGRKGAVKLAGESGKSILSKQPSGDLDSSTDDRISPAPGSSSKRRRAGDSESGGSKQPLMASGGKRLKSGSRRYRNSRRQSSRRASCGEGGGRGSVRGNSISSKVYEQHDDDFDDIDQESGRNFRCLDNSVALLIKTRFEETLLRIALVAIIFVAAGMFIILSLPPEAPPKEVVDILVKT